MKIVTLGVYGSSEKQFFDALLKAKVDVFCDIRMRRGMRGATYAFANSISLQSRLKDIGIRYVHLLDLAPTQDIRMEQKNADKKESVLKQKRQGLSSDFIRRYENEILTRFDTGTFREQVQAAQVAALFCVEREPLACHRSLAAKFLADKLNITVEDLKP